MHGLLQKFKEVSLSVLLITVFVTVLNFTIVKLPSEDFIQFVIGAVLVYIGLSIFLFGVDLSVTPIGDHMGKVITKPGKLPILVFGGFLLIFIMAIAEPSLIIFGGQVEKVTGGQLKGFIIMMAVAIGFGLAAATGFTRIIKSFPLNILLSSIYLVVFALMGLVHKDYHGIAFDAAAATTGSIVVPYLLAITVSVAAVKQQAGTAEEDSFGLLGIATGVATLTTLLLGALFVDTHNLLGDADQAVETMTFITALSDALLDVTLSIAPVIFMFIASLFLKPRLSQRQIKRMGTGLIYTFIGLTIFLTGVYGGFMDVGRLVGNSLAKNASKGLIIFIGFLLGLLTILAEPSVYVQTDLIEEVSSGAIKRGLVLISLSIGVGLAVAFAMIRIILPQVELWHIVLVGYLSALVLSFFTPKIFVGIGFDGGAVASGPMTATFMLAFVQGVADGFGGGGILDGFGIIGLVALMPVVALQVLGLLVKLKTRKEKERGAQDGAA